MSFLDQLALKFVAVMALIFFAVTLVLILWLSYLYLVDTRQKQSTLRRNYPLLGRLRYQFEHLGEFFRQYFFALDREEMPFNRVQRSWVYRAAKNLDMTLAFGSTKLMNQTGEFLFLNHHLPILEQDSVEAPAINIGEGYVKTPYLAKSIFNISGMSFGAISEPAVRALSNGAKSAGIWLNTGEGGLSPFHLEGGCDLVFQIGTAKYGVRNDEGGLDEEKLAKVASHETVRMFEIKLSQGAKPGKGGILPGVKVTDIIATTRGIPVGHDSISPNGHPEIHSVDDMIDLIERVRKVTNKPTGIKFVLGRTEWLDEFFTRIHQRGIGCAPDFITLDSGDGGTGAAPQALMDNVGLTLRDSLPILVDKLVEYGLRDRVKVIASGKLINPSAVAWAICMGADFVNSARGFMFALGCIQAMRCNQNTCPTGVTTHKKELQKGLDPTDKSVRVANYANTIVREVGVIAHSCGVSESRELSREHIQMVDGDGRLRSIKEVYPFPSVREEYRGD